MQILNVRQLENNRRKSLVRRKPLVTFCYVALHSLFFAYIFSDVLNIFGHLEFSVFNYINKTSLIINPVFQFLFSGWSPRNAIADFNRFFLVNPIKMYSERMHDISLCTNNGVKYFSSNFFCHSKGQKYYTAIFTCIFNCFEVKYILDSHISSYKVVITTIC